MYPRNLKQIVFNIFLIFSVINIISSQDDCCPGETWTKCPCKNTSGPHTRCCAIDYVCAAGGGCIYRYGMEKDLQQMKEEISDRSCHFYQTMENTFKCGDEGYANKFAGKYCQKYLDKQSVYDDPRWQKSVRKCLQRTMSANLDENYKEKGSITCNKIEQMGFDSHVPCYLNPDPNDTSISYCNLSAWDHANIFLTINPSDYVDAIPTGVIVIYNCLKMATDKKIDQSIEYVQRKWNTIKKNSNQYYDKIKSIYSEKEYKARYYINQKHISMKKQANNTETVKMVKNFNEKLKILESNENLRLLETSYNFTSKFQFINGTLSSTSLLVQNETSLEYVPIVLAENLIDPFNDNEVDSFIGLGRNSVYLEALKKTNKIKNKYFYFNETLNSPTFGIRPQFKFKSDISFCKALNHDSAWGCNVTHLFTGTRNDSNVSSNYTEQILNSNLTFKLFFQNNLDHFFYFTSKSDIYMDFFKNVYLKNFTESCNYIFTSLLTYTLQCNKTFNLTDVPDLNLVIDNYLYILKPENMLSEFEDHYELSAVFQMFDLDENEVYVGTKFFNNITLLFNEEDQVIEFYGGEKIKLFENKEPTIFEKFWEMIRWLFGIK
jgi:hypothetical protein